MFLKFEITKCIERRDYISLLVYKVHRRRDYISLLIRETMIIFFPYGRVQPIMDRTVRSHGPPQQRSTQAIRLRLIVCILFGRHDHKSKHICFITVNKWKLSLSTRIPSQVHREAGRRALTLVELNYQDLLKKKKTKNCTQFYVYYVILYFYIHIVFNHLIHEYPEVDENSIKKILVT